MTKELRVNREIRVRQVRLIGEAGEQLGVIPTEIALQIADEKNLDLVEVSPTATPPVCRLLDYGKFRYEQTKKERRAKKGQKTGLLKEIRIRPRVKEHDLETKIKIARKLLEEGGKVRVFVVFRGREVTHPELGIRALRKVAEDLKDVASFDGSASAESLSLVEGRVMNMVLTPISAKQAQAKELKVKEEV
ncbi:MAG: translation initiation factor IF-3 [Chloroflexi bacterium]|nr:translation initiation factor IF-3 [Chloroflexota bacterium]MBM4449383.1 translation initiation factor IF-3 [Chloroflexota bacterium]